MPAQAATRAKLAELGAPFGTGVGGALSNVAGVGVNRTGEGGVGAGEVYAAESGSSRISEFSTTGAFVRSWGYDVVSSGQDNTGANEQQSVQVKATKGVFSLTVTTATGVGTRTAGSTTVTGVSNTFGTFHVGDAITTGTGIPSNTTITAVGAGTLTLSQAATEASSSEITVTENTGATGTGNLTAGSAEITALSTRTGEFAVGKTVTGTGIPVGTTILAVGAGTLTLSNPVEAGKSGTGIVLTATNIPYSASAAEVQLALEALAGVNPGDVAVSGGPGDATGSIPYTVTFSGGRFAGNDVANLGQSAAGLSEGTKTVTIATPSPGGGVEICKAVSSPADVCKKGTTSTVAGGVSGPGLTVDQSTGNVYSYGNEGKRVDVFSAKGVFEGAFGWNVISSGAVGTGTLTAGSTSVTAVATTSKAFLAGQSISGTGIPAGTTIATVATNTNTITLSRPATASGAGVALTASTGAGNVAQNEKQTVTIGGAPSGGTFTLTFKAPKPSEASATATAIPFNASAAEVQAKLEGLANIGAGNVEVSGSTGGPYTVEFKGTRYADTNVTEMTASGAGLTPSGTVAIATTRDGGALELCTTASGCLPGESSASAGGFGNSGTSPRNLSVDSSGNLYVPDSGNLRYDVFSPTLNGSDEVTGASFVRAVGWGVADGTTAALQTCTATCFKGISGNGAGQLGEGLTAAIADSTGNVYTVNSVGNCATVTCRIQKFNPDGTIANASFGPSTGECSTVRSSGFVTGPSGSGVSSVAVDPTSGNVFAYIRTTSTTERICELDGSGSELGVFPGAPLTSANLGNGLAVGTGERVYAGNGNVLFVFGPVPPPVVEILPATEITQATAKLNGKVTVPSPGGEGFNTTYRFEVSADAGFHWSKVPASDVSIGSTAGTFEVHQVATGLQPNANYLVRLVATTGPSATSGQASFTTGASPPTVTESNILTSVTSSSGKVYGSINPNNGSTTYRFEYGTTTSYGSQSPAEFEPFLGSGGQVMNVSATLVGLEPNTTYHWRIVATNPSGTTKGEDRQLTTAEELQQLNQHGLPDNRGFELVSPVDKGPQSLVMGVIPKSSHFQAAEDGQSVVYPLLGGATETDSGGENANLARRSPAGWISTKVTPPSLVDNPINGLAGTASPGWVTNYSPDLSCLIVNSFNPLTADTPPVDVELGISNLYIRHGDGSYTLVTKTVPSNPGFAPITPAGPPIVVAGASADCSKIYFTSKFDYLPEATGLYEWDNGTLRDAGRLPNGLPSAGTIRIGSKGVVNGGSRLNTVASDGSRLFFDTASNEPGTEGVEAVFVRKAGGPTVEASRKQGGSAHSLGARYEAASVDGSRVFFVATYGLTPASSSGPSANCSTYEASTLRACDLYVYDVDSGQLTDLTVDTNPADSKGSSVVGALGVSEDGTTVYFAARGQLLPGKGKTYDQNVAGPGGGSANIYVKSGEDLSYVATVKVADLESSLLFRARTTAQTTPDGAHFLFESTTNITGYDSNGISEAYLYSSQDDTVVCISCRGDGQPSVGVPSTTPLLITISQDDSAYTGSTSQMSDDGSRIAFTMPDVLAPGAVSGNDNIYLWQRGQTYLLLTDKHEPAGDGASATRIYGSSNSGDDIFIRSANQYSPYDKDLTFDLYDVRVDGGFAPPPPPAAQCDPAADECQAPPTPQPGAPSPPSVGFSGPGNPPPPAVQKQGKRKKVKKQKKRNRGSARGRDRNRAAKTNRGGAK